LYAALTGRQPFVGENNFDILMQLIEQEPQPPRELNHAVPRNLETICLKCLEKEPERRYESAQALADDLQRFLRGEPILARPPGPIGRLRRWSRKHPTLAVTWAALGAFYLNHLILLAAGAPGEGGFYHFALTLLVVVWASGSAAFEYLGSCARGQAALVLPYCWTAMDVIFFTIYLLIGEGPRSALIAGYLVLIAGTPLRGGVRLIWFTAVMTVVSYIGLESYTLRDGSGRAVPIYQAVIFVIGMLVVALIQHLLLRRIPPDVGAPKAVSNPSASKSN
jgi:serine/threonine-protein kinase